MAKSDFGNKQELQEYLAGLKQVDAQYKILNAEAKKFRDIPGGAKNQVKQQLRDLQSQYDTHKEILASIKLATKELADFEKTQQKLVKTTSKVTDELKKQTESIGEQERRINDLAGDFNEIDGLQNSITSNYGKQYGEVKAIQKKIDGTKELISGISELIKQDSKVYGDQLDKILDIAEQYKGMPQTFATLSKERKLGLISEKQMSQQLKRHQDEFDEMVSKLQLTNAETEKLVELFKQLNVENAAFNKPIAQKSELKSGANALITQSPLGNAPIVGSSIAKTSETIFSEDKVMAASLIGLGFLAAKATATLAAIRTTSPGGDKGDVMETYVGVERSYDALIKNIDLEIEAREKILALQSEFVQRDALFDFSTQLKQMGNEFNQISKISLFGGDLGKMPYLTDQMQLAGVGVESVVSAIHDLSKDSNLGIFPQLAANAAVFAKKLGISTSELSSQMGLYRRLNKTGGQQAYGGVTNTLSSTGGINPVDVSMEMANASKMAMTYNIRSYEALAKQVMAAKQLGVSWSQIAEDGRNMVLNYKDTIKGEMELSAMLGERVDLSEVMSLINSNQVVAAQKAFNATGLAEKARGQGLIAQQKLQSIVGENIYAGAFAAPLQTGQSANIKSNADFLAATQMTNANLKITGATIDASQSIIKLQAEDLQRGLNTLIGADKIAAELQLTKTGEELNKFMAVSMHELTDVIKHPLNSIDAILGFTGGLAGSDRYAQTNRDYIANSRAYSNGIGLAADESGTKSQKIFDANGKLINSSINVNKTPSVGLSTTGKGIDYLSKVPNQQEQVIEASKIQQQQLENLNSHTETSIELLKSLRDLTAIMLDPDRKKDFNVQLNMDGKQIKNVLIRNNQRDLGTTRDGLTFSTQGAKS